MGWPDYYQILAQGNWDSSTKRKQPANVVAMPQYQPDLIPVQPD